MRTIVFTGGGTGGHVYPGIAVIERLKEKGTCDFLWVGSGRGPERAIAEERGIPFKSIPSGKLRRYVSLENFFDLFRVLGGILASVFLFLRIKPSLLFSKGGYVGFPPVFAARLLGIPVVIHESDLDPGLATRLSAPFAGKILLPYEESAEHFPPRFRERLEVTGNPVRREILSGSAEEGRRILGFSAGGPILLVLGGSQGSREINALVRSVLGDLLSLCRVVHQTGEGDFESFDLPGYRVFPYLREELPHILAASSAVVSRAGAGALWEFLAAGKPSLLIPLRGTGTRGDQVRNAELFERLGAARVLKEVKIDPRNFLAEVERILDPGTALGMRENIRKLGSGDGAEKIAAIILKNAKKELP